MFPLSAFRLAAGLGGRLEAPGTGADFSSLSTDSRSLKKGDVFLALQGERFDGEKFFAKALQAGAGALVGRKFPLKTARRTALIRVQDPLAALQRLAADQRRLFEGPVVAITGSNGKTSAKECLAWLLGGKDLVLSTPGNWNNHIGLPLTLLGLQAKHRFAVLELGMNHVGELALLAGLCRPDVAIVLNVGDAHLGYFKSRRGVAAAKEELLQGTRSSGVAVLNGDDPLVLDMGHRWKGRRILYGRSRHCQLRAVQVEDSGAAGQRATLDWAGRSHRIRLAMGGRVRLAQAMAALAGALALDQPIEALLERLERFRPEARNRQQLATIRGARYILDMYNASPQSMDAGLELLRDSAPPEKRVALLGDMLELGPRAAMFHARAGAKAKACRVRSLAAYGPHARDLVRGAGAGTAFEKGEIAAAAAWLAEQVEPGDWVLVKGSRGMALEKILEAAGG